MMCFKLKYLNLTLHAQYLKQQLTLFLFLDTHMLQLYCMSWYGLYPVTSFHSQIVIGHKTN